MMLRWKESGLKPIPLHVLFIGHQWHSNVQSYCCYRLLGEGETENESTRLLTLQSWLSCFSGLSVLMLLAKAHLVQYKNEKIHTHAYTHTHTWQLSFWKFNKLLFITLCDNTNTNDLPLTSYERLLCRLSPNCLPSAPLLLDSRWRLGWFALCFGATLQPASQPLAILCQAAKSHNFWGWLGWVLAGSMCEVLKFYGQCVMVLVYQQAVGRCKRNFWPLLNHWQNQCLQSFAYSYWTQ